MKIGEHPHINDIQPVSHNSIKLFILQSVDIKQS